MEVKGEIKQDRNEIDQKRQVRIENSCFTIFVESNIHQKSSHAPQCGKMTNTFTEKIRQFNYLVISFVKTLFSRNFCQKRVRVNFRNFHTVVFRNFSL